MIKKFFQRRRCKHIWVYLDEKFTNDFITFEYYGCEKCGKVKSINKDSFEVWSFKQEHRGNKFK